MFGILSLPAEVFSLSTIEELFPTSLRAGTMTEASFSRNWHGGASVRGNTWTLLTPKGSAADCMVGGFLSNAGATQPLYNPKCKPQKLGFTFRYWSNSETIWEHEQLLTVLSALVAGWSLPRPLCRYNIPWRQTAVIIIANDASQGQGHVGSVRWHAITVFYSNKNSSSGIKMGRKSDSQFGRRHLQSML